MRQVKAHPLVCSPRSLLRCGGDALLVTPHHPSVSPFSPISVFRRRLQRERPQHSSVHICEYLCTRRRHKRQRQIRERDARDAKGPQRSQSCNAENTLALGSFLIASERQSNNQVNNKRQCYHKTHHASPASFASLRPFFALLATTCTTQCEALATDKNRCLLFVPEVSFALK